MAFSKYLNFKKLRTGNILDWTGVCLLFLPKFSDGTIIPALTNNMYHIQIYNNKTNIVSFSDKWILRRNEEESLLPGLKYSQRQLFWVSAANVWCAKYRPKALKLRVLTGVHAPDMFRVRGPFSNMNEFARDFKCPIGSPMNRREKCQVW